MKLVRYGSKGKEKPGLIDKEGKLRDLSGVIPDWGPEQLDTKVINKILKIKTSRSLWSKASHDWDHRSQGLASFSPLA